MITNRIFTVPLPYFADLISAAQTAEEPFLRQYLSHDQMAEWSKQPLIMAKADGVYYWDVTANAISTLFRHLCRLVGHNNRR